MVEGVGAWLVQDINVARSYACNITAATVLKTAKARLIRVSIVADDGTAGTVFDCAALNATAASNAICVVPTSAGGSIIMLAWPCSAGVTIVPGNGQTLAVSLA